MFEACSRLTTAQIFSGGNLGGRIRHFSSPLRVLLSLSGRKGSAKASLGRLLMERSVGNRNLSSKPPERSRRRQCQHSITIGPRTHTAAIVFHNFCEKSLGRLLVARKHHRPSSNSSIRSAKRVQLVRWACSQELAAADKHDSSKLGVVTLRLCHVVCL